MLLTSNVNAKQLEVSVVILNWGDRRTFVAKPESYDLMERVARDIFNIGRHVPIAFSISTLDYCNGNPVEISHSAYEAMLPLLDVLVVNTSVDGPSSARVTLPTPSATPAVEDHGRASDSGLVEHEDNSDSDEERETSPPIENQIVAEPPVEEDIVDDTHTYNPHDQELEKRSVTLKIVEDTQKGPMTDVREKEIGLMDEQMEFSLGSEGIREGRPARPMHIKTEPTSPTLKGAPETPIHNNIPAGIDPPLRKLRTEEKTLSAKQERLPSRAPTRVPRAIPTAEESQQSLESGQTSFTLTITCTASKETATVKTRSGHLVGKVLKGVCKKLGLNFERSRLVQYVGISQDGNIEYVKFECENGDDLAKSGIDENSILAVEEAEDEDE